MGKNSKTKIGDILIYKPKGQQVHIEVNLQDDTVWLNLNQIAALFEKDKSVISRHLRNIYKAGELTETATVAKNATVQQEGNRKVVRHIDYYNLDAILSVGYRVNSKRGTQFRIWATHILRDHLVKGYTLNEKRLKQEIQKYRELKSAIGMIGNVLQRGTVESDQAAGLLKVITDFAYALDVLDAYDYQRLEVTAVSRKKGVAISYEEARNIIKTLESSIKQPHFLAARKIRHYKVRWERFFRRLTEHNSIPA